MSKEKPEFTAEGIASVIGSLADVFTIENVEKYPDVIKEYEYTYNLYKRQKDTAATDLKAHAEAVNSISLNVRSVLAAQFDTLILRNDLTEQNQFFFTEIKYGTLEKLVDDYIKENEGMGMSGDKSSFIMNRIVKSVVENRDDIGFVSTYADAGRPEMDEDGKVPYWVPQSVSSVKEMYTLLKTYNSLKRTLLRKDFLERLENKE